jgi:yecA family protein
MEIDTQYQTCLDELQVLLQQYAVNKSFNEVQGFLTAVAVAGDFVEVAPWRQKLLGMEDKILNDIPDDIYYCLEEAVDHLMEELLDPDFTPQVSSERVHNIRLPKVDEWAKGFLACLKLIEDDWDEILASSSIDHVRQMVMLNVIVDPQQFAPLMFSEDVDYRSAKFLKEIRAMAGPIASSFHHMVLYAPDDLNEFRSELADILEQHAAEAPHSLTDEQLMEWITTRKDTVSLQTIEECVRRQDTMSSKICAYLNDDAHWEAVEGEGQWWALLHCVFILGKMTGEPAAATLLKVMARKVSDPQAGIWEWLDAYWPAFFANKSEFALAPLTHIAQDHSLLGSERFDAFQCLLSFGYEKDSQQLEDTINLVATLVQSMARNDESRFMCASLLLDFPRPRHRDLLKQLAREQRKIVFDYFSAEDITAAFSRGDRPEWIQFSNPWWFYQPGQIAERQLRWREQDAEVAYPGEFDDDFEVDDFEVDDFDEFTEDEFSEFFLPAGYPNLGDTAPYLHNIPKVGRNDPCPCGSGKKYKKCCLH